MSDSTKNSLAAIVCTIFAIAILSGFSLLGKFSTEPTDLKPGDPVYLLSGQTVIQAGRPCQENQAGFISPTSKEASRIWYKAERLFWPTNRLVSVILSDGSIGWYLDFAVVKSPADPALLLCPAAD